MVRRWSGEDAQTLRAGCPSHSPWGRPWQCPLMLSSHALEHNVRHGPKRDTRAPRASGVEPPPRPPGLGRQPVFRVWVPRRVPDSVPAEGRPWGPQPPPSLPRKQLLIRRGLAQRGRHPALRMLPATLEPTPLQSTDSHPPKALTERRPVPTRLPHAWDHSASSVKQTDKMTIPRGHATSTVSLCVFLFFVCCLILT